MRNCFTLALSLCCSLALAQEPAAAASPFLTDVPPAKEYAFTGTDSLDGKLDLQVGKHLRIETSAAEVSYSRAFDATDNALGLTAENTIRLRYKHNGPFIYARRTLETLNTLTTMEPRDRLQLQLRVIKTPDGHVKLLADRVIVLVLRH